MATRAFSSAGPGAGQHGAQASAGLGAPGLDDDFMPGERIGAPPAASGLGPITKAWMLILTLACAGWLFLGDGADWAQWAIARAAALREASVIPPQAPATPEPASADAAPPAAQPLAELPVSTRPDSASDTAGGETPVAPTAPDDTPDDMAAAVPYAPGGPSSPTAGVPLEPPVADPDDPYQARALAAGLHPGLSRALLSRLTAADYRNAGKAIDKAIAETADDGVLAWPRQRKPGQALFEVHFVPGAAPSCRRYVVTVSLEGWATTALPMERCGVVQRNARAG